MFVWNASWACGFGLERQAGPKFCNTLLALMRRLASVPKATEAGWKRAGAQRKELSDSNELCSSDMDVLEQLPDTGVGVLSLCQGGCRVESDPRKEEDVKHEDF